MRSLLLLVALLGACKEEATPESTDAAAVARSFGAQELGVFVTLPMGWVEDAVEANPTSAKEATPAVVTKEIRTVAQARRVSTGKAFLVSPKLVVTIEPTARKNPQEVFEQTLADLKKLDAAADVGVVRSTMSSRFVGREQVGELEIAYFVRAGDSAKEVIHRSLLVLRRPPEGSRAIVTLTATYLAEDAETVSAEIQSIMSSLRLEGAMAVE
jgi:type II secretory pathway component GspD/PulD (secretin)